MMNKERMAVPRLASDGALRDSNCFGLQQADTDELGVHWICRQQPFNANAIVNLTAKPEITLSMRNRANGSASQFPPICNWRYKESLVETVLFGAPRGDLAESVGVA
jgi:hypothetical protein